ncbi:helix-turn-helix domain-containing protein [Kordia sp.]|uniref:helix-turn-helix domain-containing protein n=1 Tax=Kordia sp. TaxID=1965332 RepID=UPI003B599304
MLRKSSFLLYGIVLLCLFSNCSSNIEDDERLRNELLVLINKNVKKNPNQALKDANKLIAYGIEYKDTVMLVKVLLKKGAILTDKGEHKKALEVLDKGYNLFNEPDSIALNANPSTLKLNTRYNSIPKSLRSELEFKYLLRKGNAYVLYGDNDNALTYYSKVSVEATKQKKLEDAHIARINIAKVTRNIGKLKEALRIYKEAYEDSKLEEVKCTPRNRNLIELGIGGTYLTLHMPDSALYYSNKGLKSSLEREDEVVNSYFYHDIGIAYNQKGEYQTALVNLNKAKTFVETLDNDERLAESYFHIGKSYFGLKQYNTSIEKLTKVIQLVNQSERISETGFRPQELVETYELLAKNYHELFNQKKSDLYAELGKKLSAMIDSKTKKINDKLYETEIRKRDVLIKQKDETVAFYFYIIAAVSALCIIILLPLLYYKKKAKTNKKMFDKLMSDNTQKNKEEIKSATKEVVIDDSKVTEILKRLEKIEAQEYFLESSCSLANMAKKAKTNATYLTKILKQYKEKTFYQYLNELRINYAIERLKKDKLFRQYTVKHIALEVGYKSPESFTKHFKKATGINPSYYIKELEKHVHK